MRPLGRVITVSKSNRVIVKASYVPSIGDVVYDEKLSRIGFVADIMGPVSSPYVSVKLEVADYAVNSLVGRVLYVESKRVRRRRSRR